ncbi:MAG: methylated-DNA--[protein]-cysteine S-methyltransferase [Myxococcales bacterium]|nr:methylated-DNA--[protein]-cysteine S-methyltransferase [Myxococcales bacterium]MCB9669660.1 methylated-DNA--[protein]-cysteine S-methyltransferase [Alphaproteobacteria bacterium]
MPFTVVVPTPVGPLTVTGGEAVHTACFVDGTPTGGDPLGVREALEAWMAGDDTLARRVPLDLEGTLFQKRVWEAVRAVPWGRTASYGAIADALGSVARAVGGANGANPAALFVPCHRVIGGDGSLTGYAGGIERKRWLLDHERGAPPLLMGRSGTPG